jgi:hypothetical protein
VPQKFHVERMNTYQNKTSREDGKNVGCMNERRKVVNSGNTRRPATSDANAHKFNNTRLLKEKCKAKRCGGQGSNLIFCSFSGGRWDD